MGMLELRGHTVLVICALQGGSHRCIGDGDTYVVVVIVVNGGGHSTFKQLGRGVKTESMEAGLLWIGGSFTIPQLPIPFSISHLERSSTSLITICVCTYRTNMVLGVRELFAQSLRDIGVPRKIMVCETNGLREIIYTGERCVRGNWRMAK
ncbi:hypothetical protein EV424DRAFT_1422619 [Suillus variegatus]|nr:hypothetical protein EV424DRAFT_1422619 [Suillus variegatus]